MQNGSHSNVWEEVAAQNPLTLGSGITTNWAATSLPASGKKSRSEERWKTHDQANSLQQLDCSPAQRRAQQLILAARTAPSRAPSHLADTPQALFPPVSPPFEITAVSPASSTSSAKRSRPGTAQKRYRERQKVRMSTSLARTSQLESELQLETNRNVELQQHVMKLEEALRLAVCRIYRGPSEGPVEALQEILSKRTSGDRIKGLPLQEGKVAVLNVSGPVMVTRQMIAALTVAEFLKLLKVHKSLQQTATFQPPLSGSRSLEAAH
ncbi:hypothetical protein WJX84_003872 [Apatococcus fuscideae]|uniref:BZIP domain-containing protein n=1 Tax=Apatococcus fuscideae TaxID=2026836 RepID=A0AAW1SYF0_9CHLO